MDDTIAREFLMFQFSDFDRCQKIGANGKLSTKGEVQIATETFTIVFWSTHLLPTEAHIISKPNYTNSWQARLIYLCINLSGSTENIYWHSLFKR